jgi:hypothetical protein
MISINSEGGCIGSFWWRNRSPEFHWNIQISNDSDPWMHKFYVQGAFGFDPLACPWLKFKPNDILLTEVSCQGGFLALDEMPKAFVNLVKTTVIDALIEVQRGIIHDSQIKHLNTCLSRS